VRELFRFIGSFRPKEVEPAKELKPFIPDYIPIVGEVDPFIKIPRPDGAADGLGISRLDEPSVNESDRSMILMQLKASHKVDHAIDEVGENRVTAPMRTIEDAESKPEQIQKWIQSIEHVHAQIPQPKVQYKQSMPSLEDLMQVWDDRNIPGAAAGKSQAQRVVNPSSSEAKSSDFDYASHLMQSLRIPCGLESAKDVKQRHFFEGLHMFFSLFSAVKENLHFVVTQKPADNC
jgi:intraflagellar transport protein 46